MIINFFILLINLLSSIVVLLLGLACLLSPLGTVEIFANVAQTFVPVQLFIRDREIPLWLLRGAGIVAILIALWEGYLTLAELFTRLIG
jgi:hypothetical protein